MNIDVFPVSLFWGVLKVIKTAHFTNVASCHVKMTTQLATTWTNCSWLPWKWIHSSSSCHWTWEHEQQLLSTGNRKNMHIYTCWFYISIQYTIKMSSSKNFSDSFSLCCIWIHLIISLVFSHPFVGGIPIFKRVSKAPQNHQVDISAVYLQAGISWSRRKKRLDLPWFTNKNWRVVLGMIIIWG